MMNDDPRPSHSLTAAFRALAEDEALNGVSPQVEARLRAEVRSIASAQRRAYAKTAAVAAGLVLAMALPISQLARRSGPSRALRPADAVTAASAADPLNRQPTEFLPLAYSTIPVTGGQIVTLEVPPAVLASFGLATGDFVTDSPSMVLAEVLVGEDGLARAVRFVRPERAQEERPQ